MLHVDGPAAECRNTCQVGECAYVVTDADAFNAAGGLDEGSEYEACEVRQETAVLVAQAVSCATCNQLAHQGSWDSGHYHMPQVCHKVTKADGAAMLECDACLRGFHTTCLRPRLPKNKPPEVLLLCCSAPHMSAVILHSSYEPRPYDVISPLLTVTRAVTTLRLQGDWLCPSCKAGEPPPLQQTQAVTLRQKLLSRAAGLAVLRIESLHRRLESSGHQKGKKRGNAECEFTFTGRWYCLPEETRHGRQAGTGWPLVQRMLAVRL